MRRRLDFANESSSSLRGSGSGSSSESSSWSASSCVISSVEKSSDQYCSVKRCTYSFMLWCLSSRSASGM